MIKKIIIFMLIFGLLNSIIIYAGSTCQGTTSYACSDGGNCQSDTSSQDNNGDGDTSDPGESTTTYSCEPSDRCYSADPTASFQSNCRTDFNWQTGNLNTVNWDSLDGNDWKKVSEANKIGQVPADKVQVTEIPQEYLNQLTASQLAYGDNLETVGNLNYVDKSAAQQAIQQKWGQNVDFSQISGLSCTIDSDGKITNGDVTLDLQNDITSGTPSITALSGGGFSFSGTGTVKLPNIGLNGFLISSSQITLNGNGASIDNDGNLYLNQGASIKYLGYGGVIIEATSNSNNVRVYFFEFDPDSSTQVNSPGIYIGMGGSHLEDGTLSFVGVTGQGSVTEDGQITTVTATELSSGEYIKIQPAGNLAFYNVPTGEVTVAFGGQSVTLKDGKYYGCNQASGSCPAGTSSVWMDFYGADGSKQFTMTKDGITASNLGNFVDGTLAGWDAAQCATMPAEIQEGCYWCAEHAPGVAAGEAEGRTIGEGTFTSLEYCAETMGGEGACEWQNTCASMAASLQYACNWCYEKCASGAEGFGATGTTQGSLQHCAEVMASEGEESPIVLINCTDNTTSGSCSLTKPKYCYNGTLIDKCSNCSCPADYSCQTNESCILNAVVVLNCSDGTLPGQCSTTSIGKYCDNINLIDLCSLCPCQTGYSCQSNGTCILKCNDGTLPGQCSTTNVGQFCNNGILINKCSFCTCQIGYNCQNEICITPE